MKTIGFVTSEMENEERRAILPKHLSTLQHADSIFIEKDYGQALGIQDEAYEKMGAEIVSREEALTKDIVCDVKVGEADYFNQLSSGQTIFGWVHAVSNAALTQQLIKQQLTVIAWEEMYEAGRHVFWRNNEIAGEAAILHAFTLFGKLPNECSVALIGRGNVAMGAHHMLSSLGAKVKVFNRDTVDQLSNEVEQFDVVVNGVLWDKSRSDHLLYKEDLKKFKAPAMIIDVSSDEAGAIETSKPTTFEKPTYIVDDVLHYSVDHTPTIFKHSVSESISLEVSKYLDALIEDKVADNKVLSAAMILQNGQILDDKLKK